MQRGMTIMRLLSGVETRDIICRRLGGCDFFIHLSVLVVDKDDHREQSIDFRSGGFFLGEEK